MSQWRVASAKNPVSRHIYAELFFHRLLDVDIAEYSKALIFQSRCDLFDGGGKWPRDNDVLSVHSVSFSSVKWINT